MSSPTISKARQLLKTLGPGLLFASTAIGTSHLVLSTRAGAHHGMMMAGIILIALLLKYPFFEFGTRYANGTGNSLLIAYKKQGTWAIVLFIVAVVVNMFAVTGAIAAVSAGLLSSMFGISALPIPILAGAILAVSVLLLWLGGYAGLDRFIKFLTVVLLVTILIAFIAVLIKGPITKNPDFIAPALLEGAGLTLLVSLIGWMPSGLEASTMNSIWTIEKVQADKYQPSLKEALFDFNLGYIFTAALALMFLTIGAFTVYGSGQVLGGNATAFSNKLLTVFVANLGDWVYPFMATAAFGTIYGTLVTVIDAFSRGFTRAWRVFAFQKIENNEEQVAFLQKNYKLLLVVVGLGGFLLFYFSAAGMIKILEAATILSFFTAPVIAFLNWRAMQSGDLPGSHQPAKWLVNLAYVGLIAMIVFPLFFLWAMLA